MSDDNAVQYEGYVIRATPYQLKKDNKWKIEVYIEKHPANEVKGRPFTAENTFDTEEEAIKQSLIYGKKIIDGDIIGFNVDNL
jgi:hypothetical protein